MKQENQQGKQQLNDKMLFYFGMIKTWASILYMPMRTGMGRYHLGFCPLFGVFLIFVWSELAHAPKLGLYVYLIGAVWLAERIGQMVREAQGKEEHSRYCGRPWLAMLVMRKKKSEAMAKLIVEPLICALVGTLIYLYSSEPNAAPFFWGGSFAMAFWEIWVQGHDKQHVRQMRDTMIENSHYLDRARRRN